MRRSLPNVTMSGQCKVLNVAEKNDAAKELSNVMGRGRVRRVSVECALKLLKYYTECVMKIGLFYHLISIQLHLYFIV